jgi:hypothetical protein
MTEWELAQSAAMQGKWREFYDKLRMDIIEAQCALESGRIVRASELIDSILHHARRTGIHFTSKGSRRRRRMQ